jgi:hypothetical protein
MRTTQAGIMAAVATAVSLAIAGPNEKAEFFIDVSVASAAVDSSVAVPADSSFVAGIVVSGAKKLYDYELYMVYDTARLRFVSATKGSDQCKNFLESGGGSIFFQAKKSREDSTRILIGGTLTGDESSQCVDGGGFLSLVTFKKRTADTTMLSLTKILVEDCSQSADTACVTHGAKVFPGTIGVLSNNIRAAQKRTVDFSDGTLKIIAPTGQGDAKVTLSDISGRVLRRMNIGGCMTAVDIKSVSQGVYVLSILQGNSSSSYPLLIKR